MSSIPDGPAKITFLSRKRGDARFAFVSFPERLRHSYEQKGGIFYRRDAIKCRGWEIYSRTCPEVKLDDQNILFCPGVNPNKDNRILRWPHKISLLNNLLAAINKHAGRPSWRNFKARVGAWRGRNRE